MKVNTLIVGGVTFSLMPPDAPPKRDKAVLGLVDVRQTLILDPENKEYYSPHEGRRIKILTWWQDHWEDENLCRVACLGWVSMGIGKEMEVL